MIFGFRKLKLISQLTVLAATPAVLTIAITVFAFRKSFPAAQNEITILTVIGLALAAYGIFSFILIRRITTGIRSISLTADDLASGNFTSVHKAQGSTEIDFISTSLHTLKDDIYQQSKLADDIRKGDLVTLYTPRHIQDVLGQALLDIRQGLISNKQEDEERDWAAAGLSKFVSILQSATDVKKLSHESIVALVRVVRANQGAIFLLNKDQHDSEFLEMQACYAYDRTKHFEQRIAPGEGLLGQTFLERETVYLKKVPDHFVRITSGLGDANPSFVLIVPLRMNEEVVGVAELASFREFKKHEIEFIEKIGENIAHTVSSLWVTQNTRRLLDESQEQAEHMRAQEEELRQNQEELQATQEEISRKYDALFKQLSVLNYESKFDQLKSVNSARKRSVEYYFEIIRNQVLTFSEDKMVITALREFREAFYNVAPDVLSGELRARKDSVRNYYLNDFIPKLNENTDQPVLTDDYVPAEDLATLYQYLYISGNSHPTGRKLLLNDANDGSEYSRVHAGYHPTIRNFLEKFGYYDIFLVEARTGDILYSVFKEVDFGTSLLNGPYRDTNFGRVVRYAIESTDRNFVQLIDFEPYDPSYRAPASFIASPVYDGDEKIGILVFQMPINRINQILTGNNNWREDGLGESGETRIVGSDYTLRSVSREFIEYPERYLAGLEKIGYDQRVLRQIRKMETNILLVKVEWNSVTRALKGASDTQRERNAVGDEILVAFAPLGIPDVHWVIVSTLKEEEASKNINLLKEG